MPSPCPTPHKTARFRSARVAATAADRINAVGGRVTPYRCRCGLWHLRPRRASLWARAAAWLGFGRP